MEQGLIAFQRGAFEQAVFSWLEAARFYEQEGKFDKQGEALTSLAQAYQSLGQYVQALKSLERALALAEKSGDRPRIASVLGSLGNAYIATGPVEKASRYLNAGLELARKLGNSGLVAVILNNLGNLFTSQKQYTEAIGAYTESLHLVKETGNHTLAARALTNAAMAAFQNGQPQEAKTLLDMALEQMSGLGPSHDKAYGLITIGLGYHDLRPHLPDAKDSLSLLASKTFNEAIFVAEALGDPRAASYAFGYLGKLYEDEHRYQEALQLTRRAVFAAQQVNAPESLYRWQWQTGRLLKALGNANEAISAYRRAGSTLQSIRQEVSVGYGSTRSSFREAVGPVYLELVDLLLQRAASIQERAQYEPYLMEARQTVELLKAAELRDYFRDDCVDVARSRITRLEIVSQTAVVIYPILLPDRTELLVSLPTGLKRVSVQVRAETLTQEVRQLRRNLEKRTTREYLPHAQKLYEWLIRPLEPDLASLPIDTLVFVPDGPLRTIPMAALHDGQRFLISKYAVAITPGLDLTDPRPLQRERVKVLAVGLTESVQGFPPLPYVSLELEALQRLYGANRLVNQDFLVSSVEKELKEEPFTIVHIASHGQFSSDVAKTFLLTFDDKLTMDRLDQSVGLLRFRDEPLELLTLSACETAAGDDRAALGLAGVAVKAGARSALATLWYINDQASSILIAEFYQQLQDPSVSRAIALQRAQLKLLNNPRYQHPGYWSPFLLINNWL
ncbi:MAG: CHAT domain-containing protein [candidate division NC10 bacterium]|nr:CHAT domain-containing protein [candidate division NC10 bacterium]